MLEPHERQKTWSIIFLFSDTRGIPLLTGDKFGTYSNPNIVWDQTCHNWLLINFRGVFCLGKFHGMAFSFIFIHTIAQCAQCPSIIQVCLLPETTTTSSREAFDGHRGDQSQKTQVDNHAHNDRGWWELQHSMAATIKIADWIVW